MQRKKTSSLSSNFLLKWRNKLCQLSHISFKSIHNNRLNFHNSFLYSSAFRKGWFPAGSRAWIQRKKTSSVSPNFLLKWRNKLCQLGHNSLKSIHNNSFNYHIVRYNSFNDTKIPKHCLLSEIYMRYVVYLFKKFSACPPWIPIGL